MDCSVLINQCVGSKRNLCAFSQSRHFIAVIGEVNSRERVLLIDSVDWVAQLAFNDPHRGHRTSCLSNKWTWSSWSQRKNTSISAIPNRHRTWIVCSQVLGKCFSCEKAKPKAISNNYLCSIPFTCCKYSLKRLSGILARSFKLTQRISSLRAWGDRSSMVRPGETGGGGGPYAVSEGMSASTISIKSFPDEGSGGSWKY